VKKFGFEFKHRRPANRLNDLRSARQRLVTLRLYLQGPACLNHLAKKIVEKKQKFDYIKLYPVQQRKSLKSLSLCRRLKSIAGILDLEIPK
jgi:hypothetical protein